MSEEKRTQFDQERMKNLPDEEGNAPKISFQSHGLERPRETRRCDCEHCQHFPRRISVDDFSIPKFEMRLAANQGNPKQLAALLAAKEKKTNRFLRPKLAVASPENAAIPGSTVYHQESMEIMKRFVFADTVTSNSTNHTE